MELTSKYYRTAHIQTQNFSPETQVELHPRSSITIDGQKKHNSKKCSNTDFIIVISLPRIENF